MRLGNFSSFTLPLHIHLCAPKKPMRTNGCGILAPSTRRKPPNPWRKWYSLTQYRLPDDLFAESQKAIGLEEKWETETVWRAPHHARDFKVFLGGGTIVWPMANQEVGFKDTTIIPSTTRPLCVSLSLGQSVCHKVYKSVALQMKWQLAGKCVPRWPLPVVGNNEGKEKGRICGCAGF